jgi:hypothetical protein
MKKMFALVLTLFAAMFAVTPLLAGPFGLPDNQPNGWRDSGCVEAANVEVKGADGNVLYINNPTCPVPNGPSILEQAEAAAKDKPQVEAPAS